MPLELERALRELEPDWPPTPDLALAVRARIAAPAPRVRRLWAPALAAALGALLVFAVVMAASPSARSTVLRWLGLQGVEVRHAPPAATPPRVRRGADLGLGTSVTLATARRAAGFPVPVPSTLGRPAAVYLSRAPVPRVSLVYAPGPGIPRSRISGAGLLLMALRGDPFPLIQKT